MSESKFTPGPYLRDGACIYKLSKDGVNVFAAQVSSGYDDLGGRTSTKECEAVAQLMQFAPDLLEAAIHVLTGLEARIDEAIREGRPLPVFRGIADLHDAIQCATASPMGKE